MSKYTITIKNLIDNDFDFQMTKYPIFDENYRNVLNNKILNHYYENEIGFETPALFRFYLNNKLNEIMNYYNILYEKQKILIENINNNVNLTENYTSKNTKIDKSTTQDTNNTTTETSSNSNSTNNGEQDNKSIFQDTPQGKITQGGVDEQEWATNVTTGKNTSNNTINDTSSTNGTSNTTSNSTNDLTSNGTDEYIKTIIGNNGGKFSLDILKDLSNNLLNIDMMIINELEDLFMQIF